MAHDKTAPMGTRAPAASEHEGADGDSAEDLRPAAERWFVKRGLPHFIEGYNGRQDILTRAAPFLLLVFVVEMLNALNEQWSPLINAIAVVGALIGATGVWVGVNRIRGRAPFRRPDDIGVAEVAAFLFVPPVVPLVFGGQVTQAAEVIVANVVLLVLSYVIVSYGLVPMLRWATVQMVGQVRNVGDLMVRSLPLLLLFSMFMFFNAEMWKIADDLPNAFLAASMLVVLAVGSAFIVLRLPGELEQANQFESWEGLTDLVAATPVVSVDRSRWPDPPVVRPLNRRARMNVSLTQFVSQSIQIALVTLALFAFYLLFGAFTVIPSTIEQWTGSDHLEVIGRVPFFGREVVFSWELLRTSVFISMVAGLQFTVQAVTESAYRDEFLSATYVQTRQALAVRAVYLHGTDPLADPYTDPVAPSGVPDPGRDNAPAP